MAETKTITLPSSGKVALVRTPATGRDLIAAYRLLPRKSSPPEVSMALLAQLAKIDGQPIVYEDLCGLSLGDINALLVAAELSGESEEDPTSPPAPNSPPSSDSDSQ